ncbi:cytochrome P450 2D14-like [Discoglossus pictus]
MAEDATGEDVMVLLGKKFGSAYSLQYFWKNIVVLNGFETMREALLEKSEDIADRPRFPLFERLGYNGNSKVQLLVRYNDWKEKRRFALSTLFGMGKKSLEERVTEETQIWPLPNKMWNQHAAGSECRDDLGSEMETQGGEDQQPTVGRNRQEERSREPDGRSDAEGSVDEEQFTGTVMSMEGQVSYVSMLFSYTEKVHEKVDRMIGSDRTPTMGDVLGMPYTNAMIHEIQRCGDYVPIGLTHMAYRDTETHGYLIPKHHPVVGHRTAEADWCRNYNRIEPCTTVTMVITNLSSELKDETFWEKPLQFYPKHFLEEDGKFVKREAFMVFSAGRRVCLGEQLACMEFFLFFTSLVQRFTFEIPGDQSCPREDPLSAVTHSPYTYKMCAVLRPSK